MVMYGWYTFTAAVRGQVYTYFMCIRSLFGWVPPGPPFGFLQLLVLSADFLQSHYTGFGSCSSSTSIYSSSGAILAVFDLVATSSDSSASRRLLADEGCFVCFALSALHFSLTLVAGSVWKERTHTYVFGVHLCIGMSTSLPTTHADVGMLMYNVWLPW